MFYIDCYLAVERDKMMYTSYQTVKLLRTANFWRNTIVVLFTMAMLTSCGGESSKPETSGSEASADEAPSATVSLVINGNDLMQFDKKVLKVKAGQKITLTLNHTGKMAKEAMGHNFVLLKRGTNLTKFATSALDAKDNDYIPEGDAVIAHTKLLGGGESDTITFEAPAKGSYDYVCTFPGHVGLMKGKLLVQ